MFNSNIHSKRKEFHLFGSDEVSLTAIGLGNYTLFSCSGYFGRTSDAEISAYFNGMPNYIIKNKLLCTDTTSLYMLKFNKETLKYDMVNGQEIFKTESNTLVANDLVDFIIKHRKYFRKN